MNNLINDKNYIFVLSLLIMINLFTVSYSVEKKVSNVKKQKSEKKTHPVNIINETGYRRGWFFEKISTTGAMNGSLTWIRLDIMDSTHSYILLPKDGAGKPDERNIAIGRQYTMDYIKDNDTGIMKIKFAKEVKLHINVTADYNVSSYKIVIRRLKPHAFSGVYCSSPSGIYLSASTPNPSWEKHACKGYSDNNGTHSAGGSINIGTGGIDLNGTYNYTWNNANDDIPENPIDIDLWAYKVYIGQKPTTTMKFNPFLKLFVHEHVDLVNNSPVDIIIPQKDFDEYHINTTYTITDSSLPMYVVDRIGQDPGIQPDEHEGNAAL